ncbi:MAG: helix-turn-helix domain-containing protein [Actinomycetota bacterium]
MAEVCRRHRISRETYYAYRRRYLAEGLGGLEDRSRRPHTSPGRRDTAVEEEICRMRGAHPRWGARRIQAELARRGIDPPAVSSIHQALRRNHLVAPQPPRRPQALKRFEREVSNDLWQIDATCVRLASRRKAWVMDTIDDHSRYLLAAVAAEAPRGRRPGTASRRPPPGTVCPGRSSPTTGCASPGPSRGWRLRSNSS